MHMKSYSSLIAALLFVNLLSFAAQAATHVALPPVQYVDTETTTNVPFMMGANGRHTFRFALSFAGTPSNNVEVALGVDANSDGMLSAGETELVVGWDCGHWFLWDFAVGTRHWSETCAPPWMRPMPLRALPPYSTGADLLPPSQTHCRHGSTIRTGTSCALQVVARMNLPNP